MRNESFWPGAARWFRPGPVVLLVVVLTGCAARTHSGPQVQLAEAVEPAETAGLKPGAFVPDFEFVASDGQTRHLSDVRGEVTVVVFPDTPTWPNPDIYRPVAAAARRLSEPRVHVNVILVGRPTVTAGDAERVLASAPVRSNRLVLVADPAGELHALFGPEATGQYYVINQYGRILHVGDFRDVRSFERPVEDAVQTVGDEQPEEHG